MPAKMTIELNALRLYGNHGWHEEEALLDNEFEIMIHVIIPEIKQVSTITDTVDYTKIYTLTKEVFSEREKLLETLAQKLSARIHTDFPIVQSVRITITKLTPPIVGFIGSVGVMYETDFI